MKRFAIGIFISIVLNGSTIAHAQWEQTNGPSITLNEDTIIAYSITAINGTIYAGAYNGVFKSTDSGETWVNSFYSSGCFALTTEGTSLFVGAGLSEIFRSTDQGLTWSKVGTPPLHPSDVWELVVKNGVFIGQFQGDIERSTNNGTSWSEINTEEYDPDIVASSSKIFAWSEESKGTSTISTDTGATWAAFTIRDSNVSSVATFGNHILAMTKGQPYYSSDDGTTWNSTSGLPTFMVFSLLVNGNFVVASGHSQTSISTDGGSTWTSSNLPYPAAHPDGLLQFGNKIFACGGDIYVTSDQGGSWIDDASFPVIYPLDVRSLSVVGSKIIAGTGDSGIYVTSNDGSNWNQSGLSGRTVYSLLSTSNFLFAGTDAVDTAGGIFRSSDTGATWSRMVNGISDVNALASSGNNIFAGTDSGIYLSSNAGTNWSPVFSHVHVNALAAQGSKVFAGTSANGLITSTNNGTSWSASNGTLPITDVQSLAVKGGILFAGTSGNGLFLSTDTGQSWTDVSSGLPASSVLSLEENSQQFFAGTGGNGIFRTDDSGKTWKQVDSGLVNLNVTSLAIRNGNCFAGTIGGGVWERPLSQMLFILPASVSQTQTITSQIQSYPNPFSQSTEIAFTSPTSGYAELSIVNMLGVEVARLFSGELGAGEHSFTWDADGTSAPRGVYECVVRMNGQVQTLPVVLMR